MLNIMANFAIYFLTIPNFKRFILSKFSLQIRTSSQQQIEMDNNGTGSGGRLVPES